MNDVKELVAYSKANPGKLSAGTPGVGTPHHLAAAWLNTAAKIDITHVPYRGAAPALNDLLGGQIPLIWATPVAESGQPGLTFHNVPLREFGEANVHWGRVMSALTPESGHSPSHSIATSSARTNGVEMFSRCASTVQSRAFRPASQVFGIGGGSAPIRREKSPRGATSPPSR